MLLCQAVSSRQSTEEFKTDRPTDRQTATKKTDKPTVTSVLYIYRYGSLREIKVSGGFKF